MGSSKLSSAILLLAVIAISSAAPTLACGNCPSPKTPKTPKTPKSPKGPVVPVPPVTVPVPPVTLPPVHLPPVPLPPLVKPPVTMPPVTVPPVLPPNVKPPVTLPPVTVPPITVPPILNPPVTLPPVTVPPVTVPPSVGGTPPATGRCPSPPPEEKCPVDTLKIGACVDMLGENVQVGDPAVTCCEPLAGVAGVDAALCLCTTIKAKMLNVNVVLPVALQVLANTCGKSLPPGYQCP